MGFQAYQSVEDLHPRVLQVARPADIGIFIETSFQFHYSRDFFLLRGGNKCGHDERVFAGPVKRLLDGKHARIFGCRFDK